VPSPVAHLVHLGATSYDIRDTAAALQVREAVREVLLPLLLRLERALIALARGEASTPQVGRTHGQFAVPITFGFAVSEYVSRLGKSIERLAARAADLRGKLAGAVGAYNATGLIVRDPRLFEASVLGRLGLKPSDHSTQIVEPEYLLQVLLEVATAFGVIANLADDLRNLQRSEIDEVREGVADTQVGSSTMPQKRNPWNSEHVKSLWKAFAPRVMSFFMDQISEHQRDLTNSASSRFVAEYLAGFAAAANRMLSVLASLEVVRDRMAATLEAAGDNVLAEAAYILLASSGEVEAHEALRRASREARASARKLAEVLRADDSLWTKLQEALSARGAVDAGEFFARPSAYAGLAREVALDTAAREERRMTKVEAGLAEGGGDA
jgi:adenylosuccinate lyase